MPRRLAAQECFDDAHAPAAARARLRVASGRFVGRRFDVVGRAVVGAVRHGNAEQLACQRDVVGARAGREQAVVADAMQALRQHVQQEAAHELGHVERHGRIAGSAIHAIVLYSERHARGVGLDEPTIRDCYAVRVARQIGEHLFRPGERFLRVDEPSLLAQGREELGEPLRVGEQCMRAEELELAVDVRGHKLVQHQPAEQFRQHEHGQEELRFAPDPFFSVSRQPAARYDHVHVRMMRHRAAPRVQHRREADLRAQVLRISRNPQHRLAAGLEQQIVDHRLVGVGDVQSRPAA